MTERLYYTDAYLTSFEAAIEELGSSRDVVYLDRTGFYPDSGGQPSDHGDLNRIAVTDVIDEGPRVSHKLAQPLPPEIRPGVRIAGQIDWPRRFDHMQQHTGQHLLSAVLVELFGAQTVSFHLGAESSTIDIATSSLSREQIAAAEERANSLAFSNLPVHISFHENSDDLGLRKASDREGPLRVVSIADFDRSACGGTHVRSTAEIGPILIRRLDKIRSTVRVEFLCGMRAVRRAQADYAALSQIGRLLTAPLDDTPALVESQREALKAADRDRRKLETELAFKRGAELYAATAPAASGIRRHFATASDGLDDALRAMAQGFTAQPRAFFAVTCDQPPSLLIAASPDSGIHAGNLVRELVTAAGGRGGGNPQLAQGTVPDASTLADILAKLEQLHAT